MFEVTTDASPSRKSCWLQSSASIPGYLTRRDGDEFLTLAANVPITTTAETFLLEQVNDALSKPRNGEVRGLARAVPWLREPVAATWCG